MHYSDKFGYKPLKIEISFRKKDLEDENNSDDVKTINGIKVYSINMLCAMKAGAYQSRDKIRDLFDLSFIIDRYYNHLSHASIHFAQQAFEYKGLEQFDYIVSTQKDDLIDPSKLEENFLKAMDKLNILDDYELPHKKEAVKKNNKEKYRDLEL